MLHFAVIVLDKHGSFSLSHLHRPRLLPACSTCLHTGYASRGWAPRPLRLGYHPIFRVDGMIYSTDHLPTMVTNRGAVMTPFCNQPLAMNAANSESGKKLNETPSIERLIHSRMGTHLSITFDLVSRYSNYCRFASIP